MLDGRSGGGDRIAGAWGGGVWAACGGGSAPTLLRRHRAVAWLAGAAPFPHASCGARLSGTTTPPRAATIRAFNRHRIEAYMLHRDALHLQASIQEQPVFQVYTSLLLPQAFQLCGGDSFHGERALLHGHRQQMQGGGGTEG